MAEWQDVKAMFDDIAKHARRHRTHQFIWDENEEFVVLAFYDMPEKPLQRWVISRQAVLQTKENLGRDLSWALTSIPQAVLLQSLIIEARRPRPGPKVNAPSRYERIMKDDEEDR